MKKITAYVKPFKVEPILTRLPDKGVNEVLLSEVRGYGRQKGHLESYKGEEYEYTFLPKVRIEVYCDDECVNDVEKILVDGARTGRIGDGKIVVAAVEQNEKI
jgi:nitrogen regulatory protein PII